MKIEAARADDFCARPDPQVFAALVYGGDVGLVADRRDRLAAAWCAGPSAELARIEGESLRGDPAALDTALRAGGLFAATRCVLVANATDAAAPAVAAALEAASEAARLVVAAGSLTAGSKLRKLFESARTAAAIACYETATTPGEVAAMLEAAGAGPADREALALLADLAGSLDRISLRMEIEKLGLMTAGEPVTAADVARSAPALVAGRMETLLEAVLGGRPAETRSALARLAAGGEGADAATAAALRRLRALRGGLALAAAEGCDLETALARLRPPVRFPASKAIARHGRRWTVASADRAAAGLLEAQTLIRSGRGAPALAVAERALIRAAMTAGR